MQHLSGRQDANHGGCMSGEEIVANISSSATERKIGDVTPLTSFWRFGFPPSWLLFSCDLSPTQRISVPTTRRYGRKQRRQQMLKLQSEQLLLQHGQLQQAYNKLGQLQRRRNKNSIEHDCIRMNLRITVHIGRQCLYETILRTALLLFGMRFDAMQ